MRHVAQAGLCIPQGSPAGLRCGRTHRSGGDRGSKVGSPLVLCPRRPLRVFGFLLFPLHVFQAPSAFSQTRESVRDRFPPTSLSSPRPPSSLPYCQEKPASPQCSVAGHGHLWLYLWAPGTQLSPSSSPSGPGSCDLDCGMPPSF